MEEFYAILEQCPLFLGIGRGEFPELLRSMDARTVRVRRDQMLFCAGEAAGRIGVVLEGGCHVIREDYDGSRSIVAHIPPAGVFGESYACAGVRTLPVSVAADTDSQVLLVDLRRLGAAPVHSRVMQNLLQLVARKNLGLVRKIEILSCRTTREKLMAFLTDQARQQGSSAFRIPYDRQELADYLRVDRSGLSVEIGRLRREGKLECEKNFFRLLSDSAGQK